ncbi:MAG TPA: XdhC family protein [Solirubrobacteraceae bacterium]|nr:XdhC family protein [Solirubrobacteraceae bacterium]
MITGPLSARARELTAAGSAFVTATVVRVEHPTSAEPGNVALVHEDGSIEGFVGGVCAQNSVRLYSLKAIERGEPLLLRILPDEPAANTIAKSGANADPGHEIAHDEGSVTVQNPCLSGGAIEVFLEPFLPPPRLIVAGDTPIAAALLRLGPELGLDAVPGRGDDSGSPVPNAEDLALVVAAHGRDERAILRAALDVGVPYVGLVASRKRGAAVLDALREDGADDELIGRIDTPAGLDIGARTPAEIALSILASIIEVRRRTSTMPRSWAAAPPATAVDPICGMSVLIDPDALFSERDGETYYFCGEHCRRAFEHQA